ncbi:PQQ-dependent sugar dehydrogenase [bacterium]|nr:PQQ-dependent sugar dehydrogenase [bacterium]
MLPLLLALAIPSLALQPEAAGLLRPVAAVVGLDGEVANIGADGSAIGVAALLVEQGGTIRALSPGGIPWLWLDLTDRVDVRGWERGLLGIALPPEGHALAAKWVFLHYTAKPDGRTRVSAFPLTMPDKCRANPCPLAPNPAGEVVILEVEQPFGNHNGGDIAFGPDGNLHIALGDGGAGGDPHENGQDPNTLLGAILRITPTPGESTPYTIPEGNPFADGRGGAPEIYHWGLRNPWRFSFDRATGDMWIGDVGQGKWEEVDFSPAGSPGLNFGWNDTEGRACFEPPVLCRRAGRTAPVAVYGRSEGQSITGGFVYRGEAIPALRGLYIFGDFMSQALWALDPATGEMASLGLNKVGVSSFAQGPDGEIYLLDHGGGRLLKIVPAPAATG